MGCTSNGRPAGVVLPGSVKEDSVVYAQHIDQAVAKLKKLPPEKVAEVAGFIGFLSQSVAGWAATRSHWI